MHSGTVLGGKLLALRETRRVPLTSYRRRENDAAAIHWHPTQTRLRYA
jgi:hypothetical protein